MLALLVTVLLGLSVHDHIEGAEIGDAVWSVSFRTGGSYRAERNSEAGRTVARGSWRVQGDRLEVKVASCNGPQCNRVGQGYAARIALPADGVMTVRSEPADAFLPSGSYYCLAQGCERRLGIEIVGAASPAAQASVQAKLVGLDEAREKTVVWLGRAEGAGRPTHLELCRRDPERGRAAAELLARDLASIGLKNLPTEAAPSECLYDVRLVLGSEVR